MIRPYLLLVIIVCALVYAGAAWGQWVRTPFLGVRPAAMGNAFIALADDKNALWYNPAGLSRVKKYSFDLIDTVGGFDSLDTAGRVYNAVAKRQYVNALRADRQYSRFGFFPSLIGPNFGVSVYSDIQSFLEIENFTLPQVDLYGANDLGIIVGGALPLTPYFSVGASVRAFHRVGMDTTQSTDTFLSNLSVSPAGFPSTVFQTLARAFGRGMGYGLTLGASLELLVRKDERLSVAFVAEDVGGTSFHADSGSNAPSPIPMAMSFGFAYQRRYSARTELSLTGDVRNFAQNYALVQMFHLGAELKYAAFRFRLGCNQGYVTAGAGIEKGLVKVALTTYATELGNTLWNRFERWFLLQITLGLEKPT